MPDFQQKPVVIIDYDMGNIGSISNMLKKTGFYPIVSNSKNAILNARFLILPGVGSFDTGIRNLQRLELIDILNEAVLEKKIPILGICLGMQLMTATSEEGILDGLGWIKARTRRFNFDENSQLPVPHMGWNIVLPRKNEKLFSLHNLSGYSKFYFVHSYFVECFNEEDICTTSEYGLNFVSSFQYENIYGVQFHPEKSHKYGMRFFSELLASHEF